jgi:dipeptidyl aminopeptidase/acylaminoacyl peptidase
MASPSACVGILPNEQPAASRPRPPTIDDLIRLRDIGPPDSAIFRGESPLAVAPDGRGAAFVLTRADPATNDYCVALVRLDLLPEAKPKIIDQGGEIILTPPDELRNLITPYGFPATITPKWSPDGRWIAYLKRRDERTQVWRVRADGGEASVVTHAETDVDAVAWSSDGASLVYATRPALATARQADEREGRRGFLYDDRFVPNNSNRPLVRGPIARAYFAIDLATSSIRAATADETALVDPAKAEDRPRGAIKLATAANGIRAWTAPRDASLYSPVELWVSRSGRAPVRCNGPACVGDMIGLWWSPDGTELYFLRTEGWAKSQFALYRWRPGRGHPNRVLLTDDVLFGCASAGAQLLCARDALTAPRRLVMLDPKTGRDTLLFDPNPEFTQIRLGATRRLRWRNAYGVESFGDLVLPPDYHPGARVPLVVVQYRTRGFLRGGTGDEYPIQLFASRGYAVWSVERPRSLAEMAPDPLWRTWEDAETQNIQGWRDRRSILSSVVTGVEMLIRQGLVDPARVGITGLSDGSTTARFALINTRLFSAASVGTCCMEPRTSMLYGGDAWADQLKRIGYPPATQDDPSPAFWRPASLAMNARSVRTPILMQLSDDEYLLGLESLAALRDQHQPVEMHVFPGEHHVKWQPAHRRAVYDRNLDWFDFWLRGREDPAPEKADQYRRWRLLGAQRTPGTAVP